MPSVSLIKANYSFSRTLDSQIPIGTDLHEPWYPSAASGPVAGNFPFIPELWHRMRQREKNQEHKK